MNIGHSFWAAAGLRLEALDVAGREAPPYILIGDRVHVGPHLHIGAIRGVTIGDGTLIGSFVTIIDHNHGTPSLATGRDPETDALTSKGPITVGPRCWIGDKATILPGVTIGHDVVIGANSVVTTDVPALTVVAGTPARVIRKRQTPQPEP